MTIAGEAIIILGLAFVSIGVVGMIRFKNFYTRILVTAKIDTVGLMTILIGVAVRNGFGFFSLKILLIIVIMMIINPLASHMIARSAHLSGYMTEAQKKQENENKDYL